MKDIRLVVLSGPSGAGKSTAIKVLEDLGIFCVDNLPVTLLPKFLELFSKSSEITRVATVVDVREGEFLKEFPEIFASVKEAGYVGELVYLNASVDTLLRRFSETRRRHPLSHVGTPLEGITAEKELLRDIRAHADKVIDTTDLNVHELRDLVKDYFSASFATAKLSVNFVSFGYRHGVPTDADIVMDVRFLSNPYFVDELKALDGKDEDVRGFVLSKKDAIDFLERFKGFLDYLIPLYRMEGKSYLTIAIGCTGGRHRSVVIVEELASGVEFEMTNIGLRHRDIDK